MYTLIRYDNELYVKELFVVDGITKPDFEIITDKLIHIDIVSDGITDFAIWQHENRFYVSDLIGLIIGTYDSINEALTDIQ